MVVFGYGIICVEYGFCRFSFRDGYYVIISSVLGFFIAVFVDYF